MISSIRWQHHNYKLLPWPVSVALAFIFRGWKFSVRSGLCFGFYRGALSI
jgi:hypothetical protein